MRVLDNDGEPIVMGVQSHKDLEGKQLKKVVRIVNIETFSQIVTNPLEYVEDEAIGDNLCQNKNIDVFPGKSENLERCF